MKMKKNKYLISPNINNNALTKSVKGIDQDNNQINTQSCPRKCFNNFFK